MLTFSKNSRAQFLREINGREVVAQWFTSPQNARDCIARDTGDKNNLQERARALFGELDASAQKPCFVTPSGILRRPIEGGGASSLHLRGGETCSRLDGGGAWLIEGNYFAILYVFVS